MAARGRTARETTPDVDEPLYCATFSREMQLENSFQVSAHPDQVFEYLLDINKAVGCGRGVMEDVSKRLVNDMARCIQANLESDEPAEDDVAAAVSRSAAAPATVRAAQPVNAFGLLLHLIAVRFRRLFGRGSP